MKEIIIEELKRLICENDDDGDNMAKNLVSLLHSNNFDSFIVTHNIVNC